jgi:hypothetical protein
MSAMKTQVSLRTAPLSEFKGFIRKNAAWLAILPLFAASVAQAQPAVGVQLTSGGTTWDWNPTASSTSGNDFAISNVTYSPPNLFTLTISNITFSTDPFMSASVDVQNNTLAVQSYDLIFTTPVSPSITSSFLIGGSTQGGVTDAFPDGIGIVTNNGAAPLYYGQINGTGVLALLSNPTSIVAPFAGGSASTNANAGLPGPTIPFGSITMTSIGIEHQFTLTPGDRATFTSFFEAVPVPEPASLSLLAIGGLMIVCRRRR